MATKLPNYTWPVWIGLSVAASFLLVMRTEKAAPQNHTASLWSLLWSLLWYSAPALIGMALCFAVPVFLAVLNHVNFDPRVKIVVDTILPIPFNVRISFVISGALLLVACARSVKLHMVLCGNSLLKAPSPFKYVALTALCVSLMILNLCVGIMPFVKDVYWLPFVRNTQFIEQNIQLHGGKFATIGLNSPTVSSYFDLFYVPQSPKDDLGALKNHVNYVLVPKWIEASCLKYGYEIIRQDYYLSVCHIN